MIFFFSFFNERVVLEGSNCIYIVSYWICYLQRFLPSEFGVDVDRTSAVEPAKSAFAGKIQIRRTIEAEGIPYTYAVTGCFGGYYLPTLVQFEPGLTSPPRDKVTILGDGNAKG